jgi:hypothetical protein
MPRSRVRVAAMLLVFMLGLIGCSQAPSRPEGRPTYDAAAIKLLSFQAPKLAGGVLHGRSYVRKDVAFWFWAPW